MLKKAVPVKVSIVTLRKKIAEQVPIRTELRAGEYNVIGWFSSRLVGWRTGTGVGILVEDLVRNDYAYIAGYSREGKIRTRYGEEVNEHIYVS